MTDISNDAEAVHAAKNIALRKDPVECAYFMIYLSGLAERKGLSALRIFTKEDIGPLLSLSIKLIINGVDCNTYREILSYRSLDPHYSISEKCDKVVTSCGSHIISGSAPEIVREIAYSISGVPDVIVMYDDETGDSGLLSDADISGLLNPDEPSEK